MVTPVVSAAAPVPPPPPLSVPIPPGGEAPSHPPAPMEQRAFRFVMNGGQLALEAMEEIRGDFHRRRREPAGQPGMLCYRLLDAGQRVLAEEIAAAPDYVCIVLDPNTPDEEGQPLPVRLTPPGPVTFQVRMQKVQSATQMKIYRLTEPRSTTLNAEPPGRLLATIPLPK